MKKILLLLLLFCGVSESVNAQMWKQLGQDIDGEAAGDWSGRSVAISSDAKTLAIGAPYNNGNGENSGHVRIYSYNGSIWKQLGKDINGEAAYDMSGSSVDLSSDGNTLAIGAPFNNGNGTDAGQVRIYSYNGSIWKQLGQDIDGEAAADWSGNSVALSSDGKTLAIGAPNNNNVNGVVSGHVRIYTYNGTSWNQLGKDINGEAAKDYSGYSVAISSDAKTLAIGAQGNDGNGLDAGHVRIYTYNGSSWKQLGQDIDGEAYGDDLGKSVDLSSDGKTLAIGAPFNNGNGTDAGHVRIYSYKGSSWKQLVQDIDGEAAYDLSGKSVALSSDGKTLAIGAYGNDENGDASGHVRVYQQESIKDRIKKIVEDKVSQWQQKGEFEKTEDYKKRVNETTLNQKIEKYQKEAIKELKSEYSMTIDFKKIELKKYDADNETFLLYSDQLGELILPVAYDKAQNFKQNFHLVKYYNEDFIISDYEFVLSHLEVVDNNGNKYTYNNQNQASYAQTKIDYNFSEIEIDVPNSNYANTNVVKQSNTIKVGKSDVDVDIPQNASKKQNCYALVIGNEDYSSKQSSLTVEANVEFARNDATSFKNYLVSTLGFKADQVVTILDATSAQINREISKLIALAKLDPNSQIIFYYAGHGLPDADTKTPYLVPVDVATINLKENGISLKELYIKLSSSNASKITIFLDACFSGGGRNEGLLAARSIRVKAKEEDISGNMVVFASSSGDEKSLPYNEKQHGFFTYFLLKKLQETSGDISYIDMANYINKEVSKYSLITKSIKQTPHVNVSTSVQESWKSWSFR